MEYFLWDMDPVLISIFGISIHWYGVLFATAILSGSQVMKWMFNRENVKLALLDSLFIYCILGIVIGARLVHCLFYAPEYYLSNPLSILAIWEGGLASHGGGLGVILAVYLFQRKYQLSYLWLLDRLAVATALFGFFVRLANFINSEIIGLPTQVSWAVIFEKVDNLPRHPAQLYEALAYLLIFGGLLVLYKSTSIKRHAGALFGTFLCLVFSARFAIEFVKVRQASYSSELALTTGQMLSIPFFVGGVVLIGLALKQNKRNKSAN
jgi:prolipoprotein diacylglyceryl transferase